MNIGRAVRTVRERKMLKQKELASALAISPSFLCQIEQGKREPNPELVEKIAEKLDVPIQLILLLATEFRSENPKFSKQLKDISYLMLDLLSEI